MRRELRGRRAQRRIEPVAGQAFRQAAILSRRSDPCHDRPLAPRRVSVLLLCTPPAPPGRALARIMAASLFLSTASGALQRNLRGIVSTASTTTTATRPDFAVHHEAIVLTPSSSTPLPAVLTTIDPQRFPTLSQARKLLRRGFVLINGVRSGCGSTAPGDVVALQERVAVGAAQQRGTAPFPLDIVYEDDSLGIVEAGGRVHAPAQGRRRPATHRRRRRQHDAHGRRLRAAPSGRRHTPGAVPAARLPPPRPVDERLALVREDLPGPGGASPRLRRADHSQGVPRRCRRQRRRRRRDD